VHFIRPNKEFAAGKKLCVLCEGAVEDDVKEIPEHIKVIHIQNPPEKAVQNIPRHILAIYIDELTNQDLMGHVPDHIGAAYVDGEFYGMDKLPPSIKELYIGLRVPKDIVSYIPYTVEIIYMCGGMSEEILESIPKDITEIGVRQSCAKDLHKYMHKMQHIKKIHMTMDCDNGPPFKTAVLQIGFR
jgi:hypothetical protein